MNPDSTKYPGLSSRMLAHNIDLAILIPFFWLLGSFIEDNFTLFGSCWILYLLFHSFFEMTGWHATPGKKIQRMKVVAESGGQRPTGKIFLRNFLKLLSVIPLFAGILMISWDPKKRSLHDRLTGSQVTFW